MLSSSTNSNNVGTLPVEQLMRLSTTTRVFSPFSLTLSLLCFLWLERSLMLLRFGIWCQDRRREHLLTYAQRRRLSWWVHDPYQRSHVSIWTLRQRCCLLRRCTVYNRCGSVKHLSGALANIKTVASAVYFRHTHTHTDCRHSPSVSQEAGSRGALIPTGNTLHCSSLVANPHPRTGLALKHHFYTIFHCCVRLLWFNGALVFPILHFISRHLGDKLCWLSCFGCLPPSNSSAKPRVQEVRHKLEPRLNRRASLKAWHCWELLPVSNRT